jgi:hypothetical protein
VVNEHHCRAELPAINFVSYTFIASKSKRLLSGGAFLRTYRLSNMSSLNKVTNFYFLALYKRALLTPGESKQPERFRECGSLRPRSSRVPGYIAPED